MRRLANVSEEITENTTAGANKHTHAGGSRKGSVKTRQMTRFVKEKVKARSEANVEPAAKRRGLDRSSSIEKNQLGQRGVRQRSTYVSLMAEAVHLAHVAKVSVQRYRYCCMPWDGACSKDP